MDMQRGCRARCRSGGRRGDLIVSKNGAVSAELWTRRYITRIVWVRLEGPICNLFIVVAYIPHKGRSVPPTAQATLNQVDALLKTVPKQDCIILGGDLNCQLQRNVQGCTGRWSMTQKPDNGHGENVLDLMRSHDLFAVDTAFKPKRKRWPSSLRKRVCNASYLDKDKSKRPRKLDYICVSNRWRSMVKNVCVKWGPSEHRFGRKFDHGLVSAIWHWRTKKAAKFETPNFKDMDNQSWRRFDEDLRIRIKNRQETRAKRAVTPVTPASAASDEVTG